jgi:LPXTG-site transpeptidase (sortase) family protein
VVLQIPKLGIETAIEIAEIVETDKGLGFTEPGDNPIWIPDWSRNIGQYGTALIYGHRQWGPLAKVFTDLDDLEPGDTVIVRTTNETFIFDVVETIVIDPDQLWSVIEMWDTEAIKAHESQLALLTCTPWGTALQRLIVFAVLQEDVE